MLYIGLDLGGSKIAGAAVRFRPKLFVGKIFQRETPKNLQEILAVILDIVEGVRQDYRGQALKGVGLGVAGQIDPVKGLVVNSPNIPALSSLSLQRILKEETSLPIRLENDANCFTLAEAVFGAGKGFGSVFGVTVGTGAGGGIVLNQKIISGAHFSAGEIGHITLVPNGILCSCGNRGCFEKYINKEAIIKRYFRITGKEKSPKEIELESYQSKKKNLALEVIWETGKWLGLGLSVAANLIDPDVFVIGGGISRTKTLYPPAVAEFKKRVLPPLKRIKIVPSLLGGTKAGIVGAAFVARDKFS